MLFKMRSIVKILGLSLVIVFASCERNPEDINLDGKTVLRYNESAGISYLDPAFAARFEDSWAMSQMFNGLVQLDKNLEIKPCIAKRWEISDDGLEYTFYLRQDVFFHDHELFEGGKGRKVVASDFVNSFFRIVDPEMPSPGKFIFNKLNRSEKTGSGFLALNDTTLKIFLSTPQTNFLSQLATPFCFVVPIEIADHYGDDFRKHPVGTGPFKFKLWQENVKLVMIRNENYFEKDEKGVRYPYIDAVSITFMSDKNVEMGAFKNGKLEFISGLHPAAQESMLNSDGNLIDAFSDKYKFLRHPWLKTDYIGIIVDPEKTITRESILRSREVRKAINYAINRQELVKYLRNGIGIPAETGFIPAGMPGYKDIKIKGYQYDLAKAEELMFESGMLGKGENVNVTLAATPEYKVLCEYLKKALSEIKIEVKIEIVPASVQKQMIANYTTHTFRKSWTGDYPDPLNFFQLFYSGNFSPNGPNYTHFKNT